MFDFNMPVLAIPADYREFHPTMTTPAVDDLIAEYEMGEGDMRRLHAGLMSTENRKVLSMFAQGAQAYYQSSNSGRTWSLDLIEMFDLPRALSARKEQYWFKLFELCGLSTILPSDLWNDWYKSFTAWRTCKTLEIPTFDRDTVYGALTLVESHRANFFSMRVDAVWKSLSNWHKTNWGGAFHERFIIDAMFSEYGSTTWKERAFIDLINICSTVITGADNPFFNTNGWLRDARENHTGEWVELLDGMLRIKAFLRGTLHCEVHPDVASRLNVALRYLHPNALPDEATLKRPRRKSGFGSSDLIHSKIPYQVRNYFGMCRESQREDGLWELTASSWGVPPMNGAIKRLIDDVIAQIGGVRENHQSHVFDYAPMDVINEIIKTAQVPEKVSHQFYATPADLAEEFVEWVGLDEEAFCYETSAGTGAIARHMPLQTYCVEIDRLRCMALDKQGFTVKQADFLQMQPADFAGTADAVLMNPPYAGTRWSDHFEHAIGFVRDGGIVAAILPEGAVNKMREIGGYEVDFSPVKHNRFSDTTIGVVFAKIKVGVKASAGSSPHGKAGTGGDQFSLFEAA